MSNQALPARAERTEPQVPKWDGKTRHYLYVASDVDRRLAREYLARYPDDDPKDKRVMVRKVSELRLDRLNDDHVIIPIVRDIPDQPKRRVPEVGPGGKEIMLDVEEVGKMRECKPVPVAGHYTPAPDRESEASFDVGGLINAIGAVCLPCCPRIERRGDGKGNHVEWLVLKTG